MNLSPDPKVTKAQAAEDSKDLNLVKLSLEGAPSKPLASRGISADLAYLESECIPDNIILNEGTVRDAIAAAVIKLAHERKTETPAAYTLRLIEAHRLLRRE